MCVCVCVCVCVWVQSRLVVVVVVSWECVCVCVCVCTVQAVVNTWEIRTEEHTSDLYSHPTRRSSDLCACGYSPGWWWWWWCHGNVSVCVCVCVQSRLLSIHGKLERKSTRLIYTLTLHDALPICVRVGTVQAGGGGGGVMGMCLCVCVCVYSPGCCQYMGN